MLTAIKLMYAGAAVWAVNLISALVFIIGGNKGGHAMVNGHVLTAAQASRLRRFSSRWRSSSAWS